MISLCLKHQLTVALYHPDVLHGILSTFFKVLEAAADFFVEGAGDHMGTMLRETLVRLAEIEGGGHNKMMKHEAIGAPKKTKGCQYGAID